jgi:DNA-binding PadR family transcriptional regulator
MPRSRPLTELEGTVMGVVWAGQPCTPYQVRREFLDSPSPHWSGSAGAIYPLVARLEKAGLVRSEPHATGSRRSRLYRLTPAGRRALVRWMGPPVGDDVVGVPPDPLRARMALLTLFPPAHQREVLREIERRLGEMIARARDAEVGLAGAAFSERMSRGAIAMQETRLEWVRALRRSLAGPARVAEVSPRVLARRPARRAR